MCPLPPATINAERRRWRVFLRLRSQIRMDRQQGQWDAKIQQCICDCVCMLSDFSCVQLCVTLWTIAHQVSLSTGFSRQENWSGLPSPSPGDLSNAGIETVSLTSTALWDFCVPLPLAPIHFNCWKCLKNMFFVLLPPWPGLLEEPPKSSISTPNQLTYHLYLYL